jgi:hypothetical protein
VSYDAATLDISGDADIDGTLEADAMTLNGTANNYNSNFINYILQ